MKKFNLGLILFFLATPMALGSPEIDCLNQGKALGLDKNILLQLCHGATGNHPPLCFRDAQTIYGLTSSEALELCKPKLCQ